MQRIIRGRSSRRQIRTRLAIRSIFFTLTIPGVVVVVIPYLILRLTGPVRVHALSPAQVFSLSLWVISITVLLHCIWNFARAGEGTLAPSDPPRQLVVTGLYTYTRNPMYIAVVGALLCEAIFFSSLGIFLFSLFALVSTHLFVVLYEEPRLKSLFGSSYTAYIKSVPRWGIRRTPY